jgi:PilZ domain
MAISVVWPIRCGLDGVNTSDWWTIHVPRSLSKKDERKWARLQLAIPVFIRTRDGSGKDCLEFATAVNISAGGALVVVRRSLPRSSLVSLEIPSAPIGPADGLKTSSRIMQAKAVWVGHLDDHHLLGLKFVRPLATDATAVSGRHLRKVSTSV